MKSLAKITLEEENQCLDLEVEEPIGRGGSKKKVGNGTSAKSGMAPQQSRDLKYFKYFEYHANIPR